MKSRRWIALAAGAVGAAGLLMALLLTTGEHTPDPVSAPSPTSSEAPASPFAADGMQDPSVLAPVVEVGAPTVLRAPAIGLETSLEDLSVGAQGELSAPVDFDRAGWYVDGPAPGEIGPAIIAGHVDSVTAPAVFYRLAELEDGDEVIVDTTSGQSLRFVVTGRIQSAKATFPTADVYGNVPRPELRLITCGGYFDRSTGHYTDNLIVFAALDA